jgi:hypothetical protein
VCQNEHRFDNVTLTLLEYALPLEDTEPPVKWTFKNRKDSRRTVTTDRSVRSVVRCL